MGQTPSHDQRRAQFEPASVNRDARTIELTWSTGARGRRASWFEGDWFEELDMSSGAVRLDRLNSGANLLNSHQANDLSSVLGVVERAWVEGGQGRARVRFSQRAEVAPYWDDVVSGIIRNVSVGYQVHRWSDPVRGTGDEPPTYRALDWEPMELSLVAVPFDAGAQTRANDHQPLDSPMSDQLNEQAGGDPAVRAADPAPVAPPAPPVAAATAEPQEDPAALRRELKIRKAAQMAELTADQTEAIIASGKSVDDAQIEIIRQIRLRMEGPDQGKIDSRQPAPVVTRDSGDTLMRGIEEALTARVRPGTKVSDLGREYRGHTLLEYARMYLDSRGVNTRGMTKTELVTRGFHSTSDFPLLFSNLAGKSLDAAYAEEPHTWRGIARQRNLPDFKLASDLVIGGDLTPEALLEGGEYKAGTLSEAQHQWRLATYARKVTVTRQAIINDDLSALERVPEMLGRGFRRLESNLVWGLITGNAVTSVDGQVLFHSTHNNYAASAASINTAGMNAMVKLLRKQTDIAGTTVNLRPSYMMVPTDLEATALQFLFPNGFMANTRTGENGPVTVQSAGIELIVEPRLDGAATVWYLAAAPTSVEGIVYGYLAGEEGPTVTTTEKRDPDGIELLARFDFGCAVKDYRFIARSVTV
jgi:hypothetical protein